MVRQEELNDARITFKPIAEVRDLQNRLLRRTIELCAKSHPFYSKLMKQEGLEPRHIQTTDDLVRLPPTSKKDFLSDPEAFRIDPAALDPEAGTVWKVVYTTGTTSGRPAPVVVTTYDHYSFMFDQSRRYDLVGLGPGDVVANLFPLTPFPMGAYSRCFDEAMVCGASVFATHTGRPGGGFPLHRSLDSAVAAVDRHKATMIYGVAGFVRRVLIRAEELGADFSRVRQAMITGEASSDAMRADMSARMRRLGCAGDRVINRYGSTEMGNSLMECAPGSGFHALSPDQVFIEAVDEQTGARLPDGQSGMFACTHLNRTGTMFLRYMMGDVVTLDSTPCKHCGRTSLRVVSNPVRTGDIVKIKGMLVNLQTLKDRMERMPEVREYQIVIQRRDPNDPFSHDEMVLRLAVAAGTENNAGEAIAAEAVQIAQVRPRLEFVTPDQIFDASEGGKPRRVVDLRTA